MLPCRWTLAALVSARSIRRGGGARPRLAAIVLKKTAMLGVSVLAPLAFADASTGQILAGVLVGHALCGLTLGLVFQTTHLTTGTTFRDPDEDGFLDGSYGEHLLATTADFAADNALVTWIAGGAQPARGSPLLPARLADPPPGTHAHRARHGKDLGAPYRQLGFGTAIRGHFRLLRELGRGSAADHERDRDGDPESLPRRGFRSVVQ